VCVCVCECVYLGVWLIIIKIKHYYVLKSTECATKCNNNIYIILIDERELIIYGDNPGNSVLFSFISPWG